jgi:hypothetical protein
MEFSLPSEVPGHLAPSIELAILKARRAFPEQSQAKERIQAAMFWFVRIVCKATKDGEMRAEHALASLEPFLHTLCVYDLGKNRYSDSGGLDRFANPIKRTIPLHASQSEGHERVVMEGASELVLACHLLLIYEDLGFVGFSGKPSFEKHVTWA